jgi:hypothetical protein
LRQLRAEIERCQSLQVALSARLARREIPIEAFDESNALLVADLAKLTAERDALPSGNSDDDRVVVMTADEVREEFRAADRVGKRAMIKRVGPQPAVHRPGQARPVRSRPRTPRTATRPSKLAAYGSVQPRTWCSR